MSDCCLINTKWAVFYQSYHGENKLHFDDDDDDDDDYDAEDLDDDDNIDD